MCIRDRSLIAAVLFKPGGPSIKFSEKLDCATVVVTTVFGCDETRATGALVAFVCCIWLVEAVVSMGGAPVEFNVSTLVPQVGVVDVMVTTIVVLVHVSFEHAINERRITCVF